MTITETKSAKTLYENTALMESSCPPCSPLTGITGSQHINLLFEDLTMLKPTVHLPNVNSETFPIVSYDGIFTALMLDLHLVQPFTTFEQPNDLSLLKRQKRRPRPHRDGNNGRRRRRSHLRRSLVHSRTPDGDIIHRRGPPNGRSCFCRRA